MRSAHPDCATPAVRWCLFLASALITGLALGDALAQTPPRPETPVPIQTQTPTAPAPGAPAGIMTPGPSRNTPARNTLAPVAPTVMTVQPVQVMAGQTYTLNLTGTLFQSGMQLDFGNGIVIQPKTLLLSDASHARVTVQVASGTPPGQHLVTASMVASTTAAVTLKNQGPGYLSVVAGNVTGPLVLERVLPASVQQGQSATLTLEGSGFSAGMSVSFGPGISASGPVEVQSGEHASLVIRVAAQAPPMLRHPTVLISGRDVKVSPQASLTVTAVSAVVPPLPVPISYASVSVLLAVSPARLFAGESYTLTLRGLNLVPQLQVDLGAGITPKGGLRVQSPSLATLDVAVSGDAPGGMRWLGLQLPSALTPVRQDASVLVQRMALASHGFAPKPSECKQPHVAHTGTIVLDGPTFTGSMSDVGGTYNIPVLGDETDLTWHEANAGLADRFEVRFYSGSTLVATRALTAPKGYALPHDLKPDDSLIATLTQAVGGRAAKIVNQHTQPGANGPTVGWDLTWQVVGLHTFYNSCTSGSAVGANGMLIAREALGTGQQVEVEHSETVPIKQPQTGDPLLDLPDAPTGLSCSAPPPRHLAVSARFSRGGATGGGSSSQGPSNTTNLLLSNLDRQSQANGATQTADYVYDHWKLAGQLDLTASPWSLATSGAVPSGSQQNLLETETVNNVYVDWGDGTVEPLTVQWHGSSCGGQPCFQSNTETSSASLFSLDQATNQNAFLHPYSQTGSYDVRVYVLPSVNAAQQGALPASLHAGGGGLYGRLLSGTGQSPAGGSAEDALAYMLFCQTVHIQDRTDPATNGKLQLKSIRIVGFPDAPAANNARGLALAATGVRASGAGPKLGGKQTAAATPGAAAPASGTKPFATERGAGAELGRGLPGAAAAGAPAAPPQFSSCDDNLIGGATLSFIGEGTARIIWYQDGKSVGSSDEPVGPSQSRTQQQLAPPPPPSGGHLVLIEPAPPIVTDWPGLHSPPLSLAQQQIGQHSLMVTAEVVADTRPTGRVLDALGEIAGHSLTTLAPASAGGTTPARGAAGATLTASASAALAGAPPIGLLAPKGAAAAGLPPIAWVGQAPAGAPGVGLHLSLGEHARIGNLQAGPPENVTSDPAAYQTAAADPNLACTFNFPVKGGDKFIVAGLQHGGKATVTEQGGSYSGTGVLQAQFADASGTGTQPEPVTIEFKGWTMQGDGVTVAKGTFSATPPAAPMHVPGLTVTLASITGTAGDQVTATLNASLANTDIPPANGGATPSWKGVIAPLTPKGDWISGDLPIPQLLVYDSGFTLGAASAVLDLSQSQGEGADTGYCQGQSGVSWMGVYLKSAQLTAFNFDLKSPPAAPANGWAIDGYGLCGHATFPSASFPVDQGTLSWSAIGAQASQGSFSASYGGLKVHVPWLNTDFTSNQATTQLTAGAGAGQGAIMLNLTQPTKVTLSEGPITLTASNLSFGSVKAAGGWAVRSDTSFTFSSQQGQFASNVVLHGFDYGMSGAAAFDDGSSTRHISLGGQHGNIGGSLVDLKSVDVQVAPASSPTRLAFAFDSTLNLSKTLPAADVAVSYNLTQSGKTYTGNGPMTAPFKLEKPFPDANPSVHLSMTPTYVGGGSSRGNSGVLFSSNLDLGMFGGPPVSGQFVLGYVGSDDYWIARVLLDLGPTGIVAAPPVINLYKIGGGLGYNVSLASFQYQDLTQAVPQDDGTLLFDASLLVGSPDHTTFGLTGDFVIKPGGQDPGGRMDYHAWLLNPDWSGQSPIWGYFSYSGGVFDGTLNAQFSELGGQVAIDALNDAIHMHVGGGQWYFHLGTQSNPLNGQLFYYHGQAWADLGSDGFGLGLISRIDLDAGDCGSACAYIHDDWMVMAAISTSPISFSASANESFSLGACASGFCINANASAAVALSLPPPYLDFNFSLGGCPPGHINVGLQVLPSLNPSVGGNVCL
ncbi:MAG TPA: hypothetical protein VNX02_02000 [Steroidobacteraceae bacterium]|jgi:hypothetical protein|nr:hypothetical protein [Steroidobacteraceae bacterium]